MQGEFAVGLDEDAGAVYDHAAELADALLGVVLADRNATFTEQVGDPTYAAKIAPEDRKLDLGRPAIELVDHVRALSPHIGARAELHDRGVTIWKARVGDDGSFEPVVVQPDGKGRMTYEEWLRGLRR